jgi:hypothetical protein
MWSRCSLGPPVAKTVNTSYVFGGGDMHQKKILGSQPSNWPLTLFGGVGGLDAYRHPLREPPCPEPSMGYQPVARVRLRPYSFSFSHPLPSSSPRSPQLPFEPIPLPPESLSVKVANSALISCKLWTARLVCRRCASQSCCKFINSRSRS